MGKWAKSDLSYLEQLINIIPKKLCTENKEKLSNRF